MMTLYDRGQRIDLLGGYWLEKVDDNQWRLMSGRMDLALSIRPNLPVSPGGSIDRDICTLAEALAAARQAQREEDARMAQAHQCKAGATGQPVLCCCRDEIAQAIRQGGSA